MKNSFTFIFLGVLLWFLQACSVNTETTYYKDTATSMQSNILMDKYLLGMMSMGGNTLNHNKSGLDKIPTEWKSLFDIQKDGLVNLNQDSVKVLKKLFVKLNKADNEVTGLSLKYDKLLPQEIAQLFSQNKQLKKIPLQDLGSWDGKTLVIDTNKFKTEGFLSDLEKMEDDKPASAPRTKGDSVVAYGKQMVAGMAGLTRMFNMNMNNTLKFQNPIKSITGRHDFVKQIDDRTIQINVRSNDFLDGGKKLTNKDPKIIITTE